MNTYVTVHFTDIEILCKIFFSWFCWKQKDSILYHELNVVIFFPELLSLISL